MVTNKKVRLTLVGSDGNAFAILGRFQRAAKAQGWAPEAVRRVTLEATSGDYANLLATIMKYTKGKQ
jgi:hypothetical protein